MSGEGRESKVESQRAFVLYHAHCNDGFAAAWVLWLLYGELARYLPVSYGKPVPEEVVDGSEVWIVDFSYPREELKRLWARGCTVKVIDHHATAKAELEDLAYAHFDSSKCGAVLTWEKVFGDRPMPELLRYVQDRDLWQWALPESREVSAALGLYEHDFPTWSVLAQNIPQLKQEGRVALKCVEQQAKRAAAQAKVRNFGEYQVPVLNCTAFQSETAHEMLELWPQAPFVALYADPADGGLRRWSLRSRKDFDCSVVAKAHGGGGHAQACGFEEKIGSRGGAEKWNVIPAGDRRVTSADVAAAVDEDEEEVKP